VGVLAAYATPSFCLVLPDSSQDLLNGTGEFTSVKSQNELVASEVEVERTALATILAKTRGTRHVLVDMG